MKCVCKSYDLCVFHPCCVCSVFVSYVLSSCWYAVSAVRICLINMFLIERSRSIYIMSVCLSGNLCLYVYCFIRCYLMFLVCVVLVLL